MSVQVPVNVVKHIFHYQKKKFLSCCFTLLFKINEINKEAYICKSYVFCHCFFFFFSQLPKALTHPPTHKHTNQSTCLELCISRAKTHFLPMKPCAPFHLKMMRSHCVTLSRSVKSEGVGRWQVFCPRPAHQIYDDNHNDDGDKGMESEGLQPCRAFDPQMTVRKSQRAAPEPWWEPFMCHYPWIIICMGASVNLQHTEAFCTKYF